MSEELTVTHSEEPPVDIEIDKKALAKAAKAAEAKEIARIRQQYNTNTMRVRTSLLAKAGIEVNRWGVKEAGHGMLYFGGDNADRAFAAIEEDIRKLQDGNQPKAAEAIAELRKIQLRFNAQIIQVGQSHLEAAKEVGSRGGASDMRIAFPAGQPVVVAVSSKPSVNDKEKALTEGEGGA